MNIETEFFWQVDGIGTVQVIAEGNIEFESDYGADRDGNRGVPMHYLDEFNFKIFGRDDKEYTNHILAADIEEYRSIEKYAEEALFESYNQG